MVKADKAKTTLRLDVDMLEAVTSSAERDHRSVNQQIVYYISKMLEKEQQTDGKPD